MFKTETKKGPVMDFTQLRYPDNSLKLVFVTISEKMSINVDWYYKIHPGNRENLWFKGQYPLEHPIFDSHNSGCLDPESGLKLKSIILKGSLTVTQISLYSSDI